MEEIDIAQFKATCPAVVERVRKTRKPIRITKSGKPFVEIVPVPQKASKKNWLGRMKGTGRITGDVVAPVLDEVD